MRFFDFYARNESADRSAARLELRTFILNPIRRELPYRQNGVRQSGDSLEGYSVAVSVARMYSRLSRAMLLTEIPAGQAASHSDVLVQEPKPSSSI